MVENYSKPQLNSQTFKYNINDVPKFNPKMILECEVIQAEDNDDINTINSKVSQALKYEIVILRGFLGKFGLNEKLYNINYLSKVEKLKNFQIDVIEQNPEFFGFMERKQMRKKWKLFDYIKYVKKTSNFFNSELQQENSINLKGKFIFLNKKFFQKKKLMKRILKK